MSWIHPKPTSSSREHWEGSWNDLRQEIKKQVLENQKGSILIVADSSYDQARFYLGQLCLDAVHESMQAYFDWAIATLGLHQQTPIRQWSHWIRSPWVRHRHFEAWNAIDLKLRRLHGLSIDWHDWALEVQAHGVDDMKRWLDIRLSSLDAVMTEDCWIKQMWQEISLWIEDWLRFQNQHALLFQHLWHQLIDPSSNSLLRTREEAYHALIKKYKNLSSALFDSSLQDIMPGIMVRPHHLNKWLEKKRWDRIYVLDDLNPSDLFFYGTSSSMIRVSIAHAPSIHVFPKSIQEKIEVMEDITSHRTIHGHVQLLQDYESCSFKGFIGHVLNIKPLHSIPYYGTDPRQRGIAMHQHLQDPSHPIQKRLQAFEQSYRAPFETIAQEYSQRWSYQNIEFHIRIDRIDRLIGEDAIPTSQFILIDYKSRTLIFDQVLKNWQLWLYASSMPEVMGVFLLGIHKRAIEMKGMQDTHAQPIGDSIIRVESVDHLHQQAVQICRQAMESIRSGIIEHCLSSCADCAFHAICRVDQYSKIDSIEIENTATPIKEEIRSTNNDSNKTLP